MAWTNAKILYHAICTAVDKVRAVWKGDPTTLAVELHWYDRVETYSPCETDVTKLQCKQLPEAVHVVAWTVYKGESCADDACSRLDLALQHSINASMGVEYAVLETDEDPVLVVTACLSE